MELESTSLRTGDLLGGKYVVGEMIGKGGMGIVLAATHTELRRRVAIKLVRRSYASRPEFVRRFLREARALGQLTSRHAAQVLDFGAHVDGSPYMVLEYLDGSDLAVRLRASGGRLDVVEAVGSVLQACEAVGEAHARGIVHRDLKPHNLFLARCADGTREIKVLDFGVARALDGEGEASVTTTDTVMGSPAYMSPEQLRAARRANERSDIWALGATLYELITGRVPFPGESAVAVFAAIVEGPPPPPSLLRAEVPDALSEAVLRCLRREEGERFASIAELATALEPFGPLATRGMGAKIEAFAAATGGKGPPFGRSDADGEPPPRAAPIAAAQATVVLPPVDPLAATAPVPPERTARRRSTSWLLAGAALGVASAAAITVLSQARGRATIARSNAARGPASLWSAGRRIATELPLPAASDGVGTGTPEPTHATTPRTRRSADAHESPSTMPSATAPQSNTTAPATERGGDVLTNTPTASPSADPANAYRHRSF
jgi:serine/threonine-protein kinase